MKLYYYQDSHGNFGDDLNAWLWPQLIPDCLDDDPQALFVGIGTLLNDLIPADPFKVVFGSGAGYGRGLPTIDRRWKFYCVRGPLTAQKLGLPPELAVTDAAALLHAVVAPAGPKKHRRAYMPHHDSVHAGDWRGLCTSLGIHYIDPTASAETVIAAIQSTEVVITEAMHGAIVADALRVPWVAVRAYSSIPHSKWVDWCQSLQLEYRPKRLPAVWDPRFDTGAWRRLKNGLRRGLAGPLLRWVARHGRPQLSAEPVFREAYGRLWERLEQFKADCRAGAFVVPSRS